MAEKYHAKALKITGAQRIAIVGLKEEDIDKAWADLGLKPGAAVGMCVRRMSTPSKFKIGVSGCPNSCGESWLKDLGFLGTPKGFKCIVGGDAGRSPRVGQELIDELDIDQSKVLAEKIIQYYRSNGKAGERIGKFIDRIGWEKFKQDVLGQPGL